MNSNHRPIEIIAPLNEAVELTRKILFQPFDLTKWLVIGFAAWLATFFSGGTFNFQSINKNDWRWQAHHYGPSFSLHDTPVWLIPLILIFSLFALAVAVLLLWVNSRGRFIFTDCIVRNRAAIVEPWREFRKEGNHYFAFQLVVMLLSLCVGGVIAVLALVQWRWGGAIFPLPLIILLAAGLVLLLMVVALVLHFMVPVMYRRRCGAMEAFRDVLSLVSSHPASFLLFVLLYLMLVVATTAIGCVAACLTCCIVALPYVGTVILLPLVMVLYAFPLCFLRQFGDGYDVWTAVAPVETLPPVPPVQEGPGQP